LGCGRSRTPEPWHEARPLAADFPVFRAPREPLADTLADHEPLAPQPTAQLTLRGALALALVRNDGLAAFSWEVRSSEARALQAGQRPNPELDMRLDHLHNPREIGRPDEARTRLILSQVLELGGQRRKRVDLAHAECDLAGWEYEAKRIEVATLVASCFVTVLGAQRRVELLRQSLEFVEGLRGIVLQRVTRGALGSVKAHQAERRVARERIDLRRAESELAVARHRLVATWGSRSARFTEAIGDLEQMKPIPDAETVMDLTQHSPTLAGWDSELARRQAAIALARAERLPEITAGAGVRVDGGSGENELLVDLEISLPIFDRKQGDILEARCNLAKAHAEQKDVEAAIHEAIVEVYQDLAASHYEAVTLRDELLPAARATYGAIQHGFEQGALKLGDLVDAQRDLVRAELQYVDTLVDYHEMLATLEGLIAQPLPETAR